MALDHCEGAAPLPVGATVVSSASFDVQDDDLTMLIRPTSPFRSGAVCFDGGIGLLSAEQAVDGTWIASGAAYELATPGTLHYLGASDDFSQGIDESKLAPFEFDCFDLTL